VQGEQGAEMGETDRSEFMKTVQEIKLAEEESDEILRSAKIEADKILRKAKEDVQIQRGKTEEEVVATKNKLLEEGSKKIESEVQKIIDKAKKDADSIRKSKLGKKETEKLVRGFLTTNE
jgi:vacuolar-type H+-ATPase subunit H